MSIILFILTGFISAIATNSQIENVNFISVADIHFDPFYDCEISNIPCKILDKLRHNDVKNWHMIFEIASDKHISSRFKDTNYALLKLTLNKLQTVNEATKPQFIVILGDFLSHHFRESYMKYSGDKSTAGFELFVKKTLQFLTLEIQRVFDHVDVYPIVGNNDAYTGNYTTVPRGKFFKETGEIWSQLIKDPTNKKLFLNNFSIAGYYAANITNHNKQKIIILNTVIFSSRTHSLIVKKAALAELKWLREQLDIAKKNHEKIILAFHIPMGLDLYATLKHALHTQEFWHSMYSLQFETILKETTPTVFLILAGHIHIVAFQSDADKMIAGIPVYITPSISPVYGNNPSFNIFSYNPLFVLNQCENYYYPLQQESLSNVWRVSNVCQSS